PTRNGWECKCNDSS
ncbi:matrix protein 2, partial [Influenza A virus (A/northern pintail/Alaska/44415-640/2008(H1N8))]